MDKVKCWVKKRKLKKGYSYYIEWQDPRTGKFRTESSGTDKAYARQKAADRRKELLSGLYKEIIAITWADFVQEHLQRIEATLSAGSHKQHEVALCHFGRLCQPKNLTVIDFTMLEKYQLTRIADDVSPATINKELRTLQSILERAVKRGYLKVNPFKGNRKALWLCEPEKDVIVLKTGEFETLLNACPDEQWEGVCIIAYYAGLRCGEILALRWDDVDMKTEILHVRNTESHLTKSRKIRHIPMSGEVIQALKQLQIHRFKNRNNVFSESMIHNVRRGFGGLVVKAGLTKENGKPKYSLHNLRKSFGTNQANSGTSPKVLQKLMGHSNIQTTMSYYINADIEEMRKAVNRKVDTA